MSRLLYNQAIIDRLQKLIEKHPDLRFGQILVNAGIVKIIPSDTQAIAEDPFYEESQVTWERMLYNPFAFYDRKFAS